MSLLSKLTIEPPLGRPLPANAQPCGHWQLVWQMPENAYGGRGAMVEFAID